MPTANRHTPGLKMRMDLEGGALYSASCAQASLKEKPQHPYMYLFFFLILKNPTTYDPTQKFTY